MIDDILAEHGIMTYQNELPEPVWYPVSEAPKMLSTGDLVYTVAVGDHRRCCSGSGVVCSIYWKDGMWTSFDHNPLAHQPTHFLWFEFPV